MYVLENQNGDGMYATRSPSECRHFGDEVVIYVVGSGLGAGLGVTLLGVRLMFTIANLPPVAGNKIAKQFEPP